MKNVFMLGLAAGIVYWAAEHWDLFGTAGAGGNLSAQPLDTLGGYRNPYPNNPNSCAPNAQQAPGIACAVGGWQVVL